MLRTDCPHTLVIFLVMTTVVVVVGADGAVGVVAGRGWVVTDGGSIGTGVTAAGIVAT